MKYIMSAAMLAPVAVVQPAFAADTAPASQEEQALQGLVAVTMGAIEIFAEIKDTATADAAAQGIEQLAVIAAQVTEVVQESDPEALYKLMQENAEKLKKLKTAYDNMLDVLEENEYFGSSALQEAVENLENFARI